MAKVKVLEGMDLVHRAAELIFGKKAEDAVLLDLRGLSTLTDYYLICTCQTEMQMRAILRALTTALGREGLKSLRSEYHPGVRWAVLDYGELIVHLFEKETRNYYSLERLWADAKSTPLDPKDYAAASEEEDEEDENL